MIIEIDQYLPSVELETAVLCSQCVLHPDALEEPLGSASPDENKPNPEIGLFKIHEWIGSMKSTHAEETRKLKEIIIHIPLGRVLEHLVSLLPGRDLVHPPHLHPVGQPGSNQDP